MIRGIYTSAAGMLVETMRQDQIANNLANVDTTGYKQDGMVFKELPAMRIRRINDAKLYPPRPIYKYPRIGKIGTGAIADETYTRWEAGKMSYTGNELDVSLDNENASDELAHNARANSTTFERAADDAEKRLSMNELI